MSLTAFASMMRKHDADTFVKDFLLPSLGHSGFGAKPGPRIGKSAEFEREISDFAERRSKYFAEATKSLRPASSAILKKLLEAKGQAFVSSITFVNEENPRRRAVMRFESFFPEKGSPRSQISLFENSSIPLWSKDFLAAQNFTGYDTYSGQGYNCRSLRIPLSLISHWNPKVHELPEFKTNTAVVFISPALFRRLEAHNNLAFFSKGFVNALDFASGKISGRAVSEKMRFKVSTKTPINDFFGIHSNLFLEPSEDVMRCGSEAEVVSSLRKSFGISKGNAPKNWGALVWEKLKSAKPEALERINETALRKRREQIAKNSRF